MTQPDLDLADPRISLDLADVTTVQTAGVGFARALAGAPCECSMYALDEQQEIIRAAVRRAGYGSRRARAAAIEFCAAAVIEWERIEPGFSSSAWGTA